MSFTVTTVGLSMAVFIMVLEAAMTTLALRLWYSPSPPVDGRHHVPGMTAATVTVTDHSSKLQLIATSTVCPRQLQCPSVVVRSSVVPVITFHVILHCLPTHQLGDAVAPLGNTGSVVRASVPSQRPSMAW